MAGSTRQQTVGRINQAADGGDGDEDKDEDEDKDDDEIPNYAVLLTALVERVGVSRMRDFLLVLVLVGYLLTQFGLSSSSPPPIPGLCPCPPLPLRRPLEYSRLLRLLPLLPGGAQGALCQGGLCIM